LTEFLQVFKKFPDIKNTDSNSEPGKWEPNFMTDRSLDKKNEIIDKAIEYFSKNGIADTKIEEITNAMGIGKGTLYLYFKGKRDLLFQCIERLTTIVIPKEVWLDIREETNYHMRFKKRLAAFLKAFPTFCGILGLVTQNLESNDPELAKKAGDAYRLLAGPIIKDLRWARNHGWIREIDEDVIAYILLASGEGMGNILKTDPRYNIEKITEIAWDFIINGIGKSSAEKTKEAGSLHWELIDRNGHKLTVYDICSNDMNYFSGRFGEGELQIPFKTISSIELQRTNETLSALIKLKNEKSITLLPANDIRISGKTEFGQYEIKLAQVTRIVAVQDNNDKSVKTM
jgi:AcrR family transcriptional regulator